MATNYFTRLFRYSGLLSTGMKSTMLVLALSLLVGCGGATSPLTSQLQPTATPTPTPITAAEVFSNHAETWEFKNGYGDLTWIDVAPQPDGSTVWHYTKNAARAYWMPDGIDAEDYFDLEQDATGAWYSTGGRIIAPFGFPWDVTHTPQDFTYATEGIAGHPRPYLILADSGITDDTIFPDITAETRWKTMMYVEKGMLISEQWEGPCIHEKWYFAIGRGLVKVIPFDQGSCNGTDPLLTMERIN
ncbi:MAG: hypothetical protein ACJ71W_22160 [Terriglobales bacterium]